MTTNSQVQLWLIICIFIGTFAWYYYNKFLESEKEYKQLHNDYMECRNENEKNKVKIRELVRYQQDVSRTFKIMDNEIKSINDHITKERQPETPQRMAQSDGLESMMNPYTLLNNILQIENRENPVFSISTNEPIDDSEQQINLETEHTEEINKEGVAGEPRPLYTDNNETQSKEQDTVYYETTQRSFNSMDSLGTSLNSRLNFDQFKMS